MRNNLTFNGLGCDCDKPVFTGLGAGEKRCGWFCRNLGKIGAVIAFINPVVGAAIVALSVYIKEESIEFKTIGGVDVGDDLPMTLAEETQLDQWIANYFEPFYKSLLQSATNLKTEIGEVKIAKSNAILKQICAIKAYSANAKTEKGLSANAIENRTRYINYLLDEVVKVVHASKDLDTKKAGLTFNLSSVDLSGINFNTSSINFEVNCAAFASSVNNATVPMTNQPVSTIDTAAQNSNKNNNGIKVIGGIAIAATIFYILQSEPKKSKN